MNVEQELTSARSWMAVLALDLQLYKASIYKLRWGTPGGLDQALPCYDEALRVLDGTDWPSELGGAAGELKEKVVAYRATLADRDVTTASAQQSRMMLAFEALRDQVRAWPDGEIASVGRGGGGGRDAMDEAVSSS
jgi:hypothetical protein